MINLIDLWKKKLMVKNEKSLKGKSIKEMSLKEFEEVEMRSVVTGVDFKSEGNDKLKGLLLSF